VDFCWLDEKSKVRVEFSANNYVDLKSEALVAALELRRRTRNSKAEIEYPAAELLVKYDDKWYSAKVPADVYAVRLPNRWKTEKDTDVASDKDICKECAEDWWNTFEKIVASVKFHKNKGQ
jgi:hypothetical protein